jgi:hypothetical protein
MFPSFIFFIHSFGEHKSANSGSDASESVAKALEVVEETFTLKHEI